MCPESDEVLAKESEKEDWSAYEVPDTVNYCDKKDHYKRSCVHQPSHLRVEKKIEKKKCLLKKLFGVLVPFIIS